MEGKKLNLHQKLIEVRKAVPYLKKDSAGFNFKYVSSSKTLGSLKSTMDKQSVLLVPEIVKHKVCDHSTKEGNHEYFTELTMVFTWVNADNPDDKIVCPFYAQGLDSGEKGVGKALTYAEKYFLLKFFNIPTDKDDPDSFQKQFTDKEEETPAIDFDTPRMMDVKQRKTIYALLKNGGFEATDDNKGDMHLLMSWELERSIKSIKDVTFEEAEKLQVAFRNEEKLNGYLARLEARKQ